MFAVPIHHASDRLALGQAFGSRAVPTPVVFERVEARPARWEYHAESVDLSERPHLDVDRLNQLGGEGWLLVGVVPAPSRLVYYFVRAAGE